VALLRRWGHNRAMPYEPSDEEKRLAELAEKYRDRLIEQAQELEQKYKDPATSDRHKERISSYLNLRQQHADHYRELVRADDPDLRDDDNIIDPRNRYGKESAKHFYFEMPFQSLATTDRADYDTFNSEQNAIAEKISNTSDAKEREILKTTKLIEA
jgi:vacuolar-type H+-ATPase subunit I/STV1